MKVEILYDSGTAKVMEDAAIISHPFYGVADGVSGMYLPDSGPARFNGLTGGQMVVRTLRQTVGASTSEKSLTQIINIANCGILVKRMLAGCWGLQVELIPGATFALAKINDDSSVDLAQGGDCLAIWENRHGTFGITRNQVLSHEKECRALIKQLMKKHNGNRAKMWEEFAPRLTMLRRERVNRKDSPYGYCLLNGQEGMKDMVYSATLPDVSILILATDGLFDYKKTEKQEELARQTIELCRKGGLGALLAKTRKREKSEKARSHEDQAEATAIAITF